MNLNADVPHLPRTIWAIPDDQQQQRNTVRIAPDVQIQGVSRVYKLKHRTR
jgi:hypothetical protein